jgi:hypothetical protein
MRMSYEVTVPGLIGGIVFAELASGGLGAGLPNRHHVPESFRGCTPGPLYTHRGPPVGVAAGPPRIRPSDFGPLLTLGGVCYGPGNGL